MSYAARVITLLFGALMLGTVPAMAGCFALADNRLPIVKASVPQGALARLTYLGHSSFQIETARGVIAVTDYYGLNGPGGLPTVVTMNNAHSTHYTDHPDPGITHVLRGWDPGGGMANHDVTVQDLRVRNVPTNVRGFGGTRYNGNSIFIFEIEDFCIAHLGHLHHELTPTHLAELGRVDVLLVPADNAWTMNHDTAATVIRQIGAPIVIPMHYFGGSLLTSLTSRLGDSYSVVFNDGPSIALPQSATQQNIVLVLQNY